MLGKNNIKQKEKFQKHENKDHDLEETKKIIIILKIQLEEVVKIQIKEKEETFEKLGYEVVSLKEELKKSNSQLKFENSTETLNDILSCHRSPFIKTSRGYNENHNTHEENPNRYDKILIGSINNEISSRKGNDD
jgi:hypothetical protein